jgi:hypothetical protein
MKLVALLLVICACEHDPRYERHHEDRRPTPPVAPVPVDATGSDKTVERHGVDVPPMPHAAPMLPVERRTQRRHR